MKHEAHSTWHKYPLPARHSAIETKFMCAIQTDCVIRLNLFIGAIFAQKKTQY